MTSSEHEVFLGLIITFLLQIFFHSFASDFLLNIGHFTKVGTPSSQTKADDEVEENDIGDEPPVERGDFSAALVVYAAPKLELNEEHASADEKVEAEQEFWDLLQALGQLD